VVELNESNFDAVVRAMDSPRPAVASYNPLEHDVNLIINGILQVYDTVYPPVLQTERMHTWPQEVQRVGG